MTVATYGINIIGRGGSRSQKSAVGMSAYGSGKTLRVASVVACAAYRAGECLEDRSQETETVYDYSDREDVVHEEIIAPSHAPAWAYDREQLWSAVEKKENRSNSQLARSIIIGLPRELSFEQNVELLRAHIQNQFVSKGMTCDFAIHDGWASDGGRNLHAHLLLTLREFEPDGSWAKRKNREWNQYDVGKKTRENGDHAYAHQRFHSAESWRDAWERMQNAFLEAADSEARISMKSYQRQGLKRQPQRHLGYRAHLLEQQGIVTKIGSYNREVRQENLVREALFGIERIGAKQRDDVAKQRVTRNLGHSPNRFTSQRAKRGQRFGMSRRQMEQLARMTQLHWDGMLGLSTSLGLSSVGDFTSWVERDIEREFGEKGEQGFER